MQNTDTALARCTTLIGRLARGCAIRARSAGTRPTCASGATGPGRQGRGLRRIRLALCGLTLSAALMGVRPVWALEPDHRMPEFTHTQSSEWINSAPLSLEALRGKVVLIDFWTFDCWNCYRSFPWLNALEGRLAGEPFVVIAVHTPEFDHERDRERIVEKAREFDLHHPIMIDNDYSYWDAVGNRYWPAFYVLDQAGVLQGRFYGETHAGERRARAIEGLIRELLTEVDR